MIECIFTIDYEIYGNGEGSLRELVYEPAQRLRDIFRKWDARFVAFVEVAELEMIEAVETDCDVHRVKQQVRSLHQEGFEIGLHLHPQWYKGRFDGKNWELEGKEYNLCVLSQDRIGEILDRSLLYLRNVVGVPNFTPMSFRAGNWLFQPTRNAAAALAERGIKIDSSVFKGGLQHNYGLDYRPASRNGYYWRFEHDVNAENPAGRLIELPIYSVMIPSWKMMTAKRVGMGQKSASSSLSGVRRLKRYLDFLRLKYPQKLDFCRMTLWELIRMMDGVILEDKKEPSFYRPIVAIGHTKDLVDTETIESFLKYLSKNGISVNTLEGAYSQCQRLQKC